MVPRRFGTGLPASTLASSCVVYISAINVKDVPFSLQVLLNMVNFSKTKSLYREGLAPVVCSRRRPQWNVSPQRKDDTLLVEGEVLAATFAWYPWRKTQL